MEIDLGRRYAEALGRKDEHALKDLLRPDIDFRAMTPGRFWEASSADVVVDDILLGQWFEPSDEIVEILGIEGGRVGTRDRVGYRFSVRNADGSYVVEQQAYLHAEDGQIAWMRVMCSGFQRT